jgi:cytochrome oxidase assembly protein ShyY1
MSVSARVVSLTVLAVILSAACVIAGLWQGSRTRDILEAERAALADPIPVLDAATIEGFPASSVGRPVTAAGEYADLPVLLIAQRELEGRPGDWVVAPFVVEGTTVAVLRGWVDAPTSPAITSPTGSVDLSGALQPFEEFYAEGVVRDDGRLVAISRQEIERAWGTPVLSLVLVQAGQVPPSQPAPLPVPLTVQTADVPFPLQNAAYTLQWFVFAAFVWVMWWLWVVRQSPRDEESQRAMAADPDSLDA